MKRIQHKGNVNDIALTVYVRTLIMHCEASLMQAAGKQASKQANKPTTTDCQFQTFEFFA